MVCSHKFLIHRYIFAAYQINRGDEENEVEEWNINDVEAGTRERDEEEEKSLFEPCNNKADVNNIVERHTLHI